MRLRLAFSRKGGCFFTPKRPKKAAFFFCSSGMLLAFATSAVGASSAADAALVPLPGTRSRRAKGADPVCSKRPKLLIISAGGIGTTTAISEFHKIPELEANCASDSDGMKHLPYNRLVAEHAHQLTDVKRILYLWGNPMHAVASLYRRGYQVTQAMKTRSEPFSDGSFGKVASERGVPRTIEAYAASKHDIFQMQKHIESYLTNRNNTGFRPALAFLQMERKTEHLDKLAHFLGVPRLALKNHMSSWETACRGVHRRRTHNHRTNPPALPPPAHSSNVTTFATSLDHNTCMLSARSRFPVAAELVDEETRFLHQRKALNDSVTAAREVVLAADDVAGRGSKCSRSKDEYVRWKQAKGAEGSQPIDEEPANSTSKPADTDDNLTFWGKAERVLMRIGEVVGGDVLGGNDSTAQQESNATKCLAHNRTAQNASVQNASAQNNTAHNSTAQPRPRRPTVQANTDSGCQPREVVADALSEELQARINNKFKGLGAITSGLDGDGFWVQHRPADWKYGVDYVR